MLEILDTMFHFAGIVIIAEIEGGGNMDVRNT